MRNSTRAQFLRPRLPAIWTSLMSSDELVSTRSGLLLLVCIIIWPESYPWWIPGALWIAFQSNQLYCFSSRHPVGWNALLRGAVGCWKTALLEKGPYWRSLSRTAAHGKDLCWRSCWRAFMGGTAAGAAEECDNSSHWGGRSSRVNLTATPISHPLHY